MVTIISAFVLLTLFIDGGLPKHGLLCAAQSSNTYDLTQNKRSKEQSIYGIEIGSSFGATETNTISPATLRKIQNGAENGNPDNTYFLGVLKYYGISITKNIEEATELLRKAANLGHKDGMTAYAVRLMDG